jgi:hypothetical protein
MNACVGPFLKMFIHLSIDGTGSGWLATKLFSGLLHASQPNDVGPDPKALLTINALDRRTGVPYTTIGQAEEAVGRR